MVWEFYHNEEEKLCPPWIILGPWVTNLQPLVFSAVLTHLLTMEVPNLRGLISKKTLYYSGC